ncbi:conserved hypothetical protein [Cupriavidus necator]|uniref:Uncharacterized protein n=1 Tax=Cupriavidus necator TaxID=106590 RepID=A0A1K0IA08_CUPNE|nr:conserved hypothetical protein [Cupriavidus necator]
MIRDAARAQGLPGPLVPMGKWGVRVHPVIVRRCSGPRPVGSLWRLLVPIAMLASVLAGKRLIAISGKLAAVRAGSICSVVHRGAFLFKTRFACPPRSAMARATAGLQAR